MNLLYARIRRNERVLFDYFICYDVFILKSTPKYLSKDIWNENNKKAIDKIKDDIEKIPSMFVDDIVDIANNVSAFIMLVFEIFQLCFYGLVGLKVGTLFFTIITVLYMCSCIIDFLENVNSINKYTYCDVQKIEFHRIRNILKLSFDYFYHILAIYMLLNM